MQAHAEQTHNRQRRQLFLSEGQRDDLMNYDFNCLVCVDALAADEPAPNAFAEAFNLLAPDGTLERSGAEPILRGVIKRNLEFRDLAVIDAAELELAAGLTALTGETGAGKSILIDALALVLGERGDALSVRQGAERAEISAEFDTGGLKALAAWL